MSVDEKQQLQDIRDATFLTEIYDDDQDSNWFDESPSYNPSDGTMLDEVLRGERTLEPSHHGGEFRELLQTMSEELQPKRYVFVYLY
jgi:hypothetical protein